MDGLLGLPRDKITADIQAFADDTALLARGHDANTLRDITQKSINTIEKWCEQGGLTLSTVKTHVIMFYKEKKVEDVPTNSGKWNRHQTQGTHQISGGNYRQ